MQAGSLLTLGYFYCPGGASLCSTNNNGNVRRQTIAAGSGFTRTIDYTYTDPMNRLSQATESGGSNEWSETYGYDNYGNRWVSAWAPALPPSGETPTSSSWFNTNNRLSGSSYDGAGNQTSLVSFGIAYDAENRQTRTTINSVTAQYAYDGDGRRVKKVSGGVTTVYVYDAQGQLAAEYASATGAAPPCQTCYLTADSLGSTRLVSDGHTVCAKRYDYRPFGEDIPVGIGDRSTNLCYGVTDPTTIQFTGKERDTETLSSATKGLDYFGARYFSAAQGRFTSPDPITVTPGRVADPQQLNLYAYARNNPLKYVDPTGMLVDYSDLSDEDKKRWKQVEAVIYQQDEQGNYVHPELVASYDALISDTRVYKIEDNSSLGAGTAGLFTITKFDGANNFSEARIDLNFKLIKGITSTTPGDFDKSFMKYSGLFGSNGFILRLAETAGHEFNHGIFAQQDPAQGVGIQKLLLGRDAAIAGAPRDKHNHTKYPLPPDVMQKVQAAESALVPTEKFAQQAEKIINGELKASQVK